MTSTSLAFVLVSMVGGLVAREARADDAPLRLRYTAPAGCPDEATFRERVRARLGRAPFDDRGARELVVEIAPEGAALRGGIHVVEAQRAPSRHREVVAPARECDEIVQSLAVIAALLLEVPPAADRDGATPAVAPPPLRARAQRARRTPARSAPSRGAVVSVGVSVGAGTLPGTSVGVSGLVGLRRGVLVVGVEARGLLGVQGHASTDPSLRLDGAIGTAGPLACLRDRLFSTCIAARLGAVRGTAPDLAQPRSSLSFFGSFAAISGISVALGAGLSIDAQVEVELPWRETSFEVDGRSVWLSSPLAAALRLGITGDIP